MKTLMGMPMRMPILKTLMILIALPVALLGCGPDSKPATSSPSNNVSVPPVDPYEKTLTDDATKNEIEIHGEPTTPEAMANTTFVLENPSQNFTMTQLGHLAWSKFQCQAHMQIKSGKKLNQAGSLIVSFYPVFTAVWRPRNRIREQDKPYYIASEKQVCAENYVISSDGRKAIGSLTKSADQYMIIQTMPSLDPISFKMRWNATQKAAGEVLCETQSRQVVLKAIIDSCRIVGPKDAK